MLSKLELHESDSINKKIEIYQEKQRLSFIAGHIMYAIQLALRYDDPTKLKLILSQFGSEDTQDLIELSFGGLKPFENLEPHNIIRFPDQVREQSLIDDSTEILDCECHCKVSFHAGETYVRWTLPRPEFILKSNSKLKLVHLGLVVMEELLHIRQIISPNTRAINTLSSMYFFDAVQSANQMEEKDQDLLSSILETDITYFQDKYFGDLQDLQWFKDRHNASDYHKTLTPPQFIDALMYLSNKYGDIENVSENILDEIFSAIDFNPYIGFPFLLAPSLYKYVSHKAILERLFRYLSDYPEAAENAEIAPIIGEVFKTLVRLDTNTEG